MPLSRREFVCATAAGLIAAPAALYASGCSTLTTSKPDGSRPAPAGGHPWSAGFTTLESENDYWVEDIEGAVPPGLNGTLFRNGPARNALAGAWFPHWFDGDGMISAITFRDGRVHYRNRYVRTRNYVDESAANRVLYRGFGKMRPGGILANALRAPHNVANTSVVYHHRKLLALWEGGPPTALEAADLSTLGPDDFDARIAAFSAHPKIDPRTGELFNFGIDYGRVTRLQPYRIDAAGALDNYPAIDLPYPVMNHDFVITDRFMIFFIGPIKLHLYKMILGFDSYDGALEWDGSQPTRILIVSRDRSAQPLWIETEPFFQFHFANAHEDEGLVLVDVARYPDYGAIGGALRNFWRTDWPAGGMSSLTRLAIEPASGKVERRELEAGDKAEFPKVSPRNVGLPYRYAYVVTSPNGAAGLQQLVTKVDCHSGKAHSHDFSPSGYPGEPVFIPAHEGRGEDDGYLATLVFDARTQRTDVVILDARDVAARPLAVAHLTHHVPFGFHGCFTEQLFVRA